MSVPRPKGRSPQPQQRCPSGRPPLLARTRAIGVAVLVAVTVALSATGPATAANAQSPSHVDNPYLGVTGYVNPEWKVQADQVPGGSRISNQPTSIWLDRVALVLGSLDSRRGLRGHLDAALAQGAGYVQVVINNLPGKDCDRVWYDTNEFKPSEMSRYQRDFIDPIAAIEADPRYRSLRIINLVEPRWVQNLVLNTGNRAVATNACDAAAQSGTFATGVRYALTALRQAGPNVYTYLDAGVYYELGWDEDAQRAIRLIVDTVKGTPEGFASVDGFVTNVAGYAPLSEPFFGIDTKVNGTSMKQSKWVDWNNYVDELPHALQVRAALISAGFGSGIGMVIDTSRNGWGGPKRPVKASTSTSLDTFVNESRVDRRRETGNWCNQVGAGLGERPVAAPRAGIDAYAWIKTPGESDGSSVREMAGTDLMCDPTYGGSRGSYHPSGALPNAPSRGAWFPVAFAELLTNAYPPLA